MPPQTVRPSHFMPSWSDAPCIPSPCSAIIRTLPTFPFATVTLMQAVLELLTISPSRASSIVWAELANIVSHNRNNKRQIAIALACSILVVPCHAQKRFFVKHDTTRLAQNAPLACECSIQCRPAYIVESGHNTQPVRPSLSACGPWQLAPG